MTILIIIGVIVAVLAVLFLARLVWWGGPWLVVWHFDTLEPLYWPCFTRRGAEWKRRQLAERNPSRQYSIEKRHWS